MKNKTKLISIIIVAVVVIAGSIFGYTKYEANVRQKAVMASLNSIDSTIDKFNKETNRDKKIAILKSFIEEEETYTEVKGSYNDNLKAMKKYFTDGYDKTISENTIQDVDNCNSKDILNANINNLKTVLTLVKSDKNIGSNSETIKGYETKINTLITRYQNRINSIETAEKAAAEAAAQAEAAKKAAETTTKPSTTKSSTKTNQSNTESKTAAKSAPSVKPDKSDPAALAASVAKRLGLKHWDYISITGGPYDSCITIQDLDTGKLYDKNGNYIGTQGEGDFE
ncbi:MAG: hypothetical protein EOM05_00260 [Clostridia bacterium]|nr:hypothetical protein [Clostridia bacterium]